MSRAANSAGLISGESERRLSGAEVLSARADHAAASRSSDGSGKPNATDIAKAEAFIVETRESYAFTWVDLDEFGRRFATVTDALTGRVTATFRDGSRIVVNEPLCVGCDAPISDGPCGCQQLAPKARRKAA